MEDAHTMRATTAALLTMTTAAGISGATIASAHAAAPTYTPPASISSNCSTGATVALNAWLASIPSGTSAAPVSINMGDASKCYLVNDIAAPGSLDVDGVRILSKAYWNITGGATLKAITNVPTNSAGRSVNRAQMVITNGNHVTVNGLRFTGHRASNAYVPALEYDRNVLVQGGTWIKLQSITADTAAGDNVQLQAYGTNWPKVVSLYGSTLRNAGRHNVSITGANGVWLTNNTLAGNHYWAVDAELSYKAWPMKAIYLTGNKSTGTNYGFLSLASRGDASAGGVDTVDVKNNTMAVGPTNYEFANINGSAATNAPTTNVSFETNTFAVRQYGISAKWITGLSAQGNKASTTATGSASDGGGRYGLLALGSGARTVTVKNNTFTPPAGGARHTVAWLQKAGSNPVATGVVSTGNTVR